MIFKFTILSDEIEDFVRIIEIDSEATFFDLHNAILDAVNYDKDQMTSFFICTEDWEKQQEITLVEMESSSEYDILVMKDTLLRDLLEDEKQKLLYVYDMLSDRNFFIELTEIIPGKNLPEAVCTTAKGAAPKQIEDDLSLSYAAPRKNNQSLPDENFFDDEAFGFEVLDDEDFGDLDFDDTNLSDDLPY